MNAGHPTRAGVLTKEEIVNRHLIADLQQEHLKETSYDLTLGQDYLGSNDRSVQKLAPEGMLEIPPSGVVLVSSREVVQTDSYVCGRFDLKIKHALHGLILQVGTQVEPNYTGQLFGLILNLSSAPVKIFFGEDLFTIEFHTLTSPVSSGPKKISDLAEFLRLEGVRDPVHSSLSEMEDGIKDQVAQQVKKEVDNQRSTWEARAQSRAASNEGKHVAMIVGGCSVLLTILLGGVMPVMISKFTYANDQQLVDEMKSKEFGGLYESSENRALQDAVSKNPRGFERLLEALERNPNLLNSPILDTSTESKSTAGGKAR